MPRHHCTVIIPTKNAIYSLPRVMDKVLNQKTPWSYEVIAIDSGSSDGTRQFLRELNRVRLIEIRPEDFGHGRTRNLGVAAADSEFVAFLTHDATPKDEYWLSNLVATAEKDTRIAGVFGRHVAYESASAFTKYDLDLHFQNFMEYPLIVYRDMDIHRYLTDLAWRQFLHFYSDNNSLMRKSIWERIPYPDVDFAEDQLWAREIIEAGFHKAYAPDAVVYHSHEYTPLDQLRRAFDESLNFSKHFGYRLSPRAVPAVAAAAKYAVSAFVQGLDDRYGPVGYRERSARAAQQVATVVGHYLGANHEKFPAFVRDRLSLDRKLFKA
ncbi:MULTISPECIES: glycosyltransferase family 2 protein [unclassified Ensifer]|uniref:glycosyltransferase family 2 protein n=1 Tax=unclassified Ensifer TaxID=2633371 RepID=UPI00300F82AB